MKSVTSEGNLGNYYLRPEISDLNSLNSKIKAIKSALKLS
jgi:hypothetical protein